MILCYLKQTCEWSLLKSPRPQSTWGKQPKFLFGDKQMGHEQHALPSERHLFMMIIWSILSAMISRLTVIQIRPHCRSLTQFSTSLPSAHKVSWVFPIFFLFQKSPIQRDEKQFFSSASAKTLKINKYLTKTPDHAIYANAFVYRRCWHTRRWQFQVLFRFSSFTLPQTQHP